MNIVHRQIDFVKDKEYVLERHCRINYECDCPWAREIEYEDYRKDWFSLKNQVNGFYGYLERTSKDSRTIAEIIEDENGCIIGYIWVPFCFDEESGFAFADIQDIYIEENYRKSGLATELISYAEDRARRSGAKVIRSGTGCENIKSIRLHEKLGYYQYRYEFEKVL